MNANIPRPKPVDDGQAMDGATRGMLSLALASITISPSTNFQATYFGTKQSQFASGVL